MNAFTLVLRDAAEEQAKGGVQILARQRPGKKDVSCLRHHYAFCHSLDQMNFLRPLSEQYSILAICLRSINGLRLHLKAV